MAHAPDEAVGCLAHVQRGGDAEGQQQFLVLRRVGVVVHVGQPRQQPGTPLAVHHARALVYLQGRGYGDDAAAIDQYRVVVQHAGPVHRQDMDIDEGDCLLVRNDRPGGCRRGGSDGGQAGEQRPAGMAAESGMQGRAPGSDEYRYCVSCLVRISARRHIHGHHRTVAARRQRCATLFRKRKKARLSPGFSACRYGSTGYTRANTRVALVPPKPKLLDITTSSCVSRLSRAIGKPSAFGSRVSMLAEPAMKPSRIISRL